MSTDIKTIVVDIGSSSMRAEESPKYIFPLIIGRPKTLTKTGSQQEDIYISSEALKNKEMNNIQYPIQHGIVSSTWSDVEKIFNYTFNNKLHIDPTEYTILTTEAIKNPKTHREKLAELLFETFNFKSLFIGVQGILSLYSSGHFTGICLEIGDGATQVAPIYKGYLIPQAEYRINFGSCNITAFLQKILKERGYDFLSEDQTETIRDIKEKHTYIATDYDNELQKINKSSKDDISYSIANGNTIKIHDEGLRCQELLFKPFLNDLDIDGVDKILFDSIKKCDRTLRKHMYENIILAGDATLTKGFTKRLEKEIKILAPKKANINICLLKDPRCSAWRGGSMYSSYDRFSQMVLQGDLYKEVGNSILHCIFY